MNPTLFDCIKLHVEEKFPQLAVQNWTIWELDQIRISTAPIVPMSDSTIEHSLVSVAGNRIYWFVNRTVWWDDVRFTTEDPTFFDLLDTKIEAALKNREIHG